MTTFGRTFCLVIVGVLCFNVKAAKKNVTVAKCCGTDEILTYDNKCLKSYNSSWNLNIYFGKDLKPFKRLPLIWILKENTRPNCTSPITEALSRKNLVPIINGYMHNVEYDQLIAPNQYCLDYNYAMFCLDSEIKDPQRITSVLVKKCCGQDAVFSETNHTCRQFKDPSYKIDVGQDKSVGAGFPDCPGNNKVVAGKLHQAQLLSNGSLWVNASDMLLPPANYCLEYIFEQAGGSASIITCQDYLPIPHTHSVSNEGGDLRFTFYPIGLAISAIFLAATLAAGSLLPASHHVLHWRCQTNHVFCLLVGDVLLCITQVAGANFQFWPCFLIAVAMHFVFLAAFFWLNTMCFNIWWTFRDLRPQSTEKSQERIRLYLYEAYAWGVPFVIVFIGAVSDLVPHERHDYEFLRPRFAENKCWFADNAEVFTYFYGPIGTLLGINLLLFILTARELTCGLWKRELVKSTTERAALGRVCLKLVVVMGVTWITDIMSWVIGGPVYAWYVTDVINCLQGVFIFVVVGCQPQVLSAVKRSWCLLRNRENGGIGTMNHDHHSSSSQGLPSVGGETLTNNSSITNTTKSVPLETNC